jgi:hypothetical protein
MSFFKQLFCKHSWRKCGLQKVYTDPVNGNLTRIQTYKCNKCDKTKKTVTGGYIS